MIQFRRSEERGRADLGWLNSYHTFSFSSYQDPAHMGFRALRVINDDRVAAGRGFGAHAHRNMEILTYVLEGTLTHKDSMGHTEVLGPNEIQKMSAGSGVIHSEFNASQTEPVHFLQIWIEPSTEGTVPNYEQFRFATAEKQNRFRLLASGKKQEGAVLLNQDVRVSVAVLTPGAELTYTLEPGRSAWVHLVEGAADLNGSTLTTGDAAALTEETAIQLKANGSSAEVLVFDLA